MAKRNERLKSVNTFSGGMSMDIDPSIAKNNTYQYAENVRIITNEDGSTGVACNYDGREFTYKIDNSIYASSIGKVNGDSAGILHERERIIHVDTCRQYAFVFTKEPRIVKTATSKVTYTKYVDRIYVLDFTKDPSIKPVFNSENATSADLITEDRLVVFKDSRKKWRDEGGYEHTTNVTFNDGDDKDNFIPLYIKSDNEASGADWNDHFFCTLIRCGEYGFKEPMSSTCIYESDTNVKIYYVDGERTIETIRLQDAYKGYYLKNASSDATTIVPDSPIDQPIIAGLDQQTGGLPIGSYQYVYYFSNAGGQNSAPSLPSRRIILYNDAYKVPNNGYSGDGYPLARSVVLENQSDEVSSNTSVKVLVKIPDAVREQYKYLYIVRLYKRGPYNSAGSEDKEIISGLSNPLVIEDVYKNSENDLLYHGGFYLKFVDNGSVPFQEMTENDTDAIINSFSALNVIFKPKFLEQKDNILFAANITDVSDNRSTFGAADNGIKKDLDFRAYQFNRKGELLAYTDIAFGEDSERVKVKIFDDGWVGIVDSNNKHIDISPTTDILVDVKHAKGYESYGDDNDEFFFYGRNANGEPVLGGYGPIVSYEFITTRIAICGNNHASTKIKDNTYESLQTCRRNDLSIKACKTPGFLDENGRILINSSYKPINTGAGSGEVSYSCTSKYEDPGKIGIDENVVKYINNGYGYANPFIEQNFRSLKRNETYQYAITFRSIGGKRVGTFFIGNVHIPSATTIPYFELAKTNEGPMMYAIPIGIRWHINFERLKKYFNDNNISHDDLRSYEIVRVLRGDVTSNDNKSIVATGVIQSLYEGANYGGLSTHRIPYDVFDRLSSGKSIYDYHFGSINPTWFVTSVGDPKCFYPKYAYFYGDKNYRMMQIVNCIPYKQYKEGEGPEELSGEYFTTVRADGGRYMPSRAFCDDPFDTNFDQSHAGSLLPANRSIIGYISPEINFAMQNYQRDYTASTIVGAPSDPYDINNIISNNGYPSINSSTLIGVTSLFSASNPDGAQYDSGNGTTVPKTYGTKAKERELLAVTKVVAFYWPYILILRDIGDIFEYLFDFNPFKKILDAITSFGIKFKYHEYYDSARVTVKSNNDYSFAAFSSIYSDATYDDTSYDVYALDVDGDNNNKYGGCEYKVWSSAFNSAGFSTDSNTYTDALCTGGISTGCSDFTGVLTNMAEYGKATTFDNIFPEGWLGYKKDSGKECIIASPGSASGGQVIVGRYFYKSNNIEKFTVGIRGDRYLSIPEKNPTNVSDIRIEADGRDYQYHYVLDTNRDAIETVASYHLYNQAYKTNNTSIFTTISPQASVLRYKWDKDQEPGANNKEFGYILRVLSSDIIVGAITDVTSFASIPDHFRGDTFGQNLVVLTGGAAGDISDSGDHMNKIGARTSPSHGEMLYITVKDFPNINGCYAEKLYGLDDIPEANYTTTIVADMFVGYNSLGVTSNAIKYKKFISVGYGLRNVHGTGSELIDNDTVSLFDGDSYIGIYDYISTYPLRSKKNGYGNLTNSSAFNDSADIIQGISNDAYESDGFVNGDDTPVSGSAGLLCTGISCETSSAEVHALIPLESQVNLQLMSINNLMSNYSDGATVSLSAAGEPDHTFTGNSLTSDIDYYNNVARGASIPISLYKSEAGRPIESKGDKWESIAGDSIFQYGGLGSNGKPVNAYEFFVSTLWSNFDIIQTQQTVRNDDTFSSDKYDVRIRYSAQKKLNASEDEYTKFSDNDFYDVDPRYGPITGLVKFKDKLLFWQDSSFGYLPVHERSIVPMSETSEGQATQLVNLTLGLGDVLKTHEYITTENGIASKWLNKYGNIVYASGVYACSDSALYWYDHNKKEVLRYGGSVERLSKQKSFQSWINKYSDGFDARLAFSFDPKYDSVLMTFRDRNTFYNIVGDTNNAKSEPAHTIVYNELIDAPMSFISGDRNFYLTQFDSLYSFDNSTTLMKEDVGVTSDSSMIRFVSNEQPTTTKVFDNIEYDAEFSDSDLNFTTINFETPSMISNDVDFVGRREDNYRFAIPRAKSHNEYEYPNRMKGKYLAENFTFNNAGGRFKLRSVTTLFRNSII